ncbi:tryptophan--tRNA ligase [Candidatus Lariskella endosymbiont of Epinotia ramella]|uniref:tryptophan--tRNA ligase n=1 Tax=Candidatus Lariskella endosymbiont of Epinotia ramella TaxID=3066224 RepID=UPI0030D56DB8
MQDCLNKNASNDQSVVLTGDRPSGPLHLGHYVGSLSSRISMQDTCKQFIMIADMQALTDNFENPKKVKDSVIEVMLDYLAVGIDPQKSTIFIQSQVPELAELTMYYMNLVNLGRLERNPTVKSEIKQKGYDNELPVGFLCYPISQAADITAFKADLVPVGEDQLPMIEQTNEIVRRFNRIYNTSCLKEAKAHLSKAPRLIGIDGKSKASKSLGNTIFLSDSEEIVKQKVFSMFTDPEHIKVSDPGKIEGNVVFAYLDIFDCNKDELSALKSHYKRGGLGDIVLKKRLNSILQEFLDPIRDIRTSLDRKDALEALKHGSTVARLTAKETLLEVQDAIGTRFFSN